MNTIDYYAFTKEQLNELIHAEVMEDRRSQRKLARRKREQRIDGIKLMLTLLVFSCIYPASMFLHWLIVGY